MFIRSWLHLNFFILFSLLQVKSLCDEMCNLFICWKTLSSSLWVKVFILFSYKTEIKKNVRILHLFACELRKKKVKGDSRNFIIILENKRIFSVFITFSITYANCCLYCIWNVIEKLCKNALYCLIARSTIFQMNLEIFLQAWLCVD